MSSSGSHFPEQISVFRSNSPTSSNLGHRSKAMSIPGARLDKSPPPPLPPPPHNEALANGDDIAWKWANPDHLEDTAMLAPIKNNSSLVRGYFHGKQHRQTAVTNLSDPESEYRKSPISTAYSPSQSGLASITPNHPPNVVRRPVSPAGMNQRLHGESPLTQQNHSQSSHAYDQRLLSKIGKSNSPPRHIHSGLSDGPVLGGPKLSIQTKACHLRRLSDGSPSAVESVSKWVTSPTSTGVSPTSHLNPRGCSMDHRYSHVNGPSIPESDLSSTSTTHHPLGQERSGLVRSRSGRDSFDSAIFTGEPNSTRDEASLRSLNLHEEDRLESKQGTKRRAFSPPSESMREQRPEQFPKVNKSAVAQSPNSRYASKHGSISSTTSSIRQNSLASSALLSSAAASSLTSMSSLDTPSAADPLQPPPYMTSTQPISSPILPGEPSHTFQDEVRSHQISTLSATNDIRSLPPRFGNRLICTCCPKKPKRFDNKEQLREHESEKQYTCTYCNNRFKNKNEAERHQNSLHLRRYSWSCAAVVGYQAVFNPATISNLQNPISDACGFCGEEFTNHPPNWEQRVDHLTNVHKFGECNSAKKFFRADHFRQHLKHSHAGKSGKWTNMLENICLREEAPSESASLSPTVNEHSPGEGSDGAGLIQKNPLVRADTPLPDAANDDAGDPA